MKCPRCSRQIAALAGNCPSCGHVFDKETYERISCYFALRSEVDQLQSMVKDGVWPKIKEISKRLEDLDALLTADVHRGSVPQDVRMEEPSEVSGLVAEEEETFVLPPAAVSEKPRSAAGAAPAAPSIPRGSSGFEANLGQKWLLVVGIVTMVFGVGYFLKYSFDQGWVGPAGRVAMAYLWGIAMLGVGNLFRKRDYGTFGLYMIGGGISTLYAATFAAFQLYHLLGQMPSFGVMVMITLLAGSLAVIYDTKWLAVLGLAGGFLTPVLLSTGQDNQIALMTYMTVLNLGLLGIALYKKWDLLNILGFVFTYLLYAAWYLSHYAHEKFWPSILFVTVFYLIYSIMPFARQFLKTERRPLEGFLIITPNSFIAFGFSYAMIREYASLEWVSVMSVFYALVFLAMATYLFRQGRQDEEAFPVLLAKSALFLVITVPLIFSGHWITIFWAAQAVALLWMGVRLMRPSLLAGAYLLLAAAVVKFLSYDYQTVFHLRVEGGYVIDSYTYLISERLITSFALLAAAGWFTISAGRNHISLMRGRGSDAPYIASVAGALLFIVLNLETSAFFHDYIPAARFAAISVLWAIFSSGLIVIGFSRKSAVLRKTSLGLFAVTICKVFLFDMSNISTPYRIISFIILGVMLVAASYLYYRFRERLEGGPGHEGR